MSSTADLKRDPHASTTLPEGSRGRILAVALLVVVLLALWALLVVPATDWYRERQDRILQRETVANRMAQIAAELPDLRQRAARNEAAAPVPLLQGNSDAVAGAALQQRLQTLATTAGATLASAEVLQGEPLGAYRRIGVRLLLSTSWPVLVKLMDAITSGTPPLLINDLQMQSARSGQDGSEPVLNASMVVFGFRSGKGS